MNRFTIVGLPRSRTSWLSVFLTWQTSFCVHEPMRLERYGKVHIYPKDTEYFGVSDSTLSMFPEEISDDSRVVIIYRDPNEVRASLCDAIGFDCDNVVNVCSSGLKIIAAGMDHMAVKFDDIDNRLFDIWSYCVPGLLFPRKRVQELIRLNVEPCIDISKTLMEVTPERLEAIRIRLEGA